MNQLPKNITGIPQRITDAFVAPDNNCCYPYSNKKDGQIVNPDPAIQAGCPGCITKPANADTFTEQLQLFLPTCFSV